MKITEVKNVLFNILNKRIKEKHHNKAKVKFVNNFDELFQKQKQSDMDYNKPKFFDEVR